MYISYLNLYGYIIYIIYLYVYVIYVFLIWGYVVCHYLLCTYGPKSLKGAPESDGFETYQTYVHRILGRGPALDGSNESHLESSNVKCKMKSCNKMDALFWAGRAHASRNLMSQTIFVVHVLKLTPTKGIQASSDKCFEALGYLL